MSKLIDVYDKYGDFTRDMFFTSVFDAIPSSLVLSVTLKESKENMTIVLDSLDFDIFNLKTVFKQWITEDYRNTDASKDYPHEYLLKSDSAKLLIWISLSGETLYIEFMYDAQDLEVEKWVIATNHHLRKKFGELKTPSFKVLSRNNKGFCTENVNTNNFERINIDDFYNNDFKEINSIITQSIEHKKSGLILLHGIPGTGKTSYIKNLISVFIDTSFVFVQNEFVQELLKPEFISFLLRRKNCVLIIEDAEKIIASRKKSETSIVSTILQLTDGLFSDYLNLKVICTFNAKLDNIDKALFRKGRMIANYEFKALSKDKTKKMLKNLGHPTIEKEMTLAEIFKFDEKDFDTTTTKTTIGFNK